MDNRSIFLCRVPTDGGTASEACWQVLVVLSANPRRKDGKSTFVIQGELRPCTLCDIHRKDVQEKLLGLMDYATVLKLTQVGGSSRPRRSGEHWLRNSAKWPRKFAIRGAPGGANHWGPQ